MSSINRFSPTLRYLCALTLALTCTRPLQAQLCNGSGNVVVFSNYDGSGNTAATRLNINVDVNIPNLKIGIASYERVTVNIAGTFAGNVTAVRWAGYGGTNNHCASTAATVITGVPAGIITYVNNPPSTVADPLGNTSIIGGYACTAPNGTGNGGGSASMYQIVNYFLSAFGPGSTLRSAFSQYGCWAGTTKTLSAAASGNCCPLVTVLPVELLAFDHQCQGEQLALHWTTAAELNNGSFTIERSRDGLDFQAVAEIAGAGDAEEVRAYQWTDPVPSTELTYYRLSQTDGNGQTQQLNTIAASPCRQDPAADLLALGSPAEGSLLLQYTRREAGDEGVELSLLDPLGHVALTRQQKTSTGNNVFFVDVSGLARGVYIVQLRTSTRVLHRKVVLP